MDGAGREIGRGPPEHQGAFQYVLRADQVRDVGDLGLGGDAPDHAFHHAHITIFESKIRHQGDEAHIKRDYSTATRFRQYDTILYKSCGVQLAAEAASYTPRISFLV